MRLKVILLFIFIFVFNTYASTIKSVELYPGYNLKYYNILNYTSLFPLTVNKKVVLKVFRGDNNITKEAQVAQSKPIIANDLRVTYEIAIDNEDDYRPIEPTDSNIAMAPVF